MPSLNCDHSVPPFCQTFSCLTHFILFFYACIILSLFGSYSLLVSGMSITWIINHSVGIVLIKATHYVLIIGLKAATNIYAVFSKVFRWLILSDSPRHQDSQFPQDKEIQHSLLFKKLRIILKSNQRS